MNDVSFLQLYVGELSTFFSFQYYGRLYRIFKGILIFLLAIPFVAFATVKLVTLIIIKVVGVAIAKGLAIIPPVSLVFGLIWGFLFGALNFIFTMVLYVFFVPDLVCKLTGKGWVPN